MSKESDALKALDEIEKIVSSKKLKEASKKDLCGEYKKIKKYLKKVLWLIERIPVYGKKIASAIRFLMQVADAVCA